MSRKILKRINDCPDVITAAELPDYLPVGLNNTYQLLKTEAIKSVKVGKKYLIPKQSIIDYLNLA